MRINFRRADIASVKPPIAKPWNFKTSFSAPQSAFVECGENSLRRPSFNLPPIERVQEALRAPMKIHQLDGEVLFDCDLSAQRRAIGAAKTSMRPTRIDDFPATALRADA
jgi:hypothetical protein